MVREGRAMSETPAPLTPAGCDLRGMSYLPLEHRSLFDSDFYALSTGDEFKAAVVLWCRSWHQVPAASLPDDDGQLASLVGCSPLHWSVVRSMALTGWIKCSDGRLYHPDIARSANRVWNSPGCISARVDRRLEILSAEWASLRREVFSRDDYTCTYCSVRGVRLECDHVVSIAKGGRSELSNLATACVPCNRSKGSRSLSSWRTRA
ncbi:MAG: hypothetical protein NVS3B2_04620 [Ramlibacter sp.]